MGPVEDYLAGLPDERRTAVEALRDTINANLRDGFEETMALYLNCEYASPTDFRERWRATGRKLDMGKSCVRFTKIDNVPLDVVAETIAAVTVEGHIGAYERSRA